jgi:hypothetical protein
VLLQGGPWTERLAVEVVDVVIELCASVVQVSVLESINSALKALRKPEPLNASSTEKVSEKLVVISSAWVDRFVYVRVQV